MLAGRQCTMHWLTLSMCERVRFMYLVHVGDDNGRVFIVPAGGTIC